MAHQIRLQPAPAAACAHTAVARANKAPAFALVACCLAHKAPAFARTAPACAQPLYLFDKEILGSGADPLGTHYTARRASAPPASSPSPASPSSSPRPRPRPRPRLLASECKFDELNFDGDGALSRSLGASRGRLGEERRSAPGSSSKGVRERRQWLVGIAALSG